MLRDIIQYALVTRPGSWCKSVYSSVYTWIQLGKFQSISYYMQYKYSRNIELNLTF